jgi:hypothetical protein
MGKLTLSQRIRIVRMGFQAECAVLNKAHLSKLAGIAIPAQRWSLLPDSVHACEDIGRCALREFLTEERTAP